VVIDQSITTGNFTVLWAIVKGSAVFNSACSSVSKPSFSQTSTTGTDGSITASWNATVSGTYFIMVKLDIKSAVRQVVPNPATVHYNFSSAGIANSSAGIDLTNSLPLIATLFPYTKEAMLSYGPFGYVDCCFWLDVSGYRAPADSNRLPKRREFSGDIAGG